MEESPPAQVRGSAARRSAARRAAAVRRRRARGRLRHRGRGPRRLAERASKRTRWSPVLQEDDAVNSTRAKIIENGRSSRELNRRPQVDNTGFATAHGKLRLDGLQLVDAAGAPVQLMGMSSHGLHWFPDCYKKSAIRHLAKTWGINVFRAAMRVCRAELFL